MSDDRIRALERLALGGDALALERLKAEWGRIQPPNPVFATFTIHPGETMSYSFYPGPMLRLNEVAISGFMFMNTGNAYKTVCARVDDRTLALTVEGAQEGCPTCSASGNTDWAEHVTHLEEQERYPRGWHPDDEGHG